mgnify:FL=1
MSDSRNSENMSANASETNSSTMSEVSIAEASKLISIGRQEEAVEIYSRIVENPADYSAGDMNLAALNRLSLLSELNPAAAVPACDQFLSKSGNTTESKIFVLSVKARSLGFLDELEESVRVLNEVKGLQVSEVLSPLVRASTLLYEMEILYQFEQHDLALQTSDELLNLPDLPPDLESNTRRIRSSIFASQGNAATGYKELEKAIKIDDLGIQERVNGYNAIAQYLAYHDKGEEAAEHLNSLIKNYDVPADNLVGIYNMLAIIASAMGDWDEELNCFSAITNLTETHPDSISEAFINMGHVHERVMEHDQVISAYTNAIEVKNLTDRAAALALIARGEYHAQSDNHAYAVVDFTKAIDLTDEQSEERSSAYLSRGRSHSELENWTDSEADFLRAKDGSEPKSYWYAEAIFSLGCLYASQGKVEEAVNGLIERAGIINDSVKKLTRADLDKKDFEYIRNHELFRKLRLKLESTWMQEG